MKFMFFSIKYRYSDILLKKILTSFKPFVLLQSVNVVSLTSALHFITSASCYHPRHQSRSLMYICGLTPRNFVELAEAVPIVCVLLCFLLIFLGSIYCKQYGPRSEWSDQWL